MERAEITQICERQVLGVAAGLFGTSQEALGKFDDYEGCANLVYYYENEGQPRILRLSYRPDRGMELIQALYRISIEEKFMSGQLGEDYQIYQERTKKIIPLLY